MKIINSKLVPDLNLYEEVGMAGLRPSTTHVDAYIEIRPAPDTKHKQPSIRIRMTDAKFKERSGTVVVSVELIPKRIAGDPDVAISKVVWEQLVKWIHLNQFVLSDYWTNEEVFTDDVLKKVKAYLRRA